MYTRAIGFVASDLFFVVDEKGPQRGIQAKRVSQNFRRWLWQTLRQNYMHSRIHWDYLTTLFVHPHGDDRTSRFQCTFKKMLRSKYNNKKIISYTMEIFFLLCQLSGPLFCQKRISLEFALWEKNIVEYLCPWETVFFALALVV